MPRGGQKENTNWGQKSLKKKRVKDKTFFFHRENLSTAMDSKHAFLCPNIFLKKKTIKREIYRVKKQGLLPVAPKKVCSSLV